MIHETNEDKTISLSSAVSLLLRSVLWRITVIEDLHAKNRWEIIRLNTFNTRVFMIWGDPSILLFQPSIFSSASAVATTARVAQPPTSGDTGAVIVWFSCRRPQEFCENWRRRIVKSPATGFVQPVVWLQTVIITQGSLFSPHFWWGQWGCACKVLLSGVFHQGV